MKSLLYFFLLAIGWVIYFPGLLSFFTGHFLLSKIHPGFEQITFIIGWPFAMLGSLFFEFSRKV